MSSNAIAPEADGAAAVATGPAKPPSVRIAAATVAVTARPLIALPSLRRRRSSLPTPIGNRQIPRSHDHLQMSAVGIHDRQTFLRTVGCVIADDPAPVRRVGGEPTLRLRAEMGQLPNTRPVTPHREQVGVRPVEVVAEQDGAAVR